MLEMLSLRWHVFRTGHTVGHARIVSVPMFDIGAKGLLYRCEGCDRTWAR